MMPSIATRTAPPRNGTTLPPGALVPVAVVGGASSVVLLTSGVGNGAIVDDDDDDDDDNGVDAGVTGAAAGVDGDGATIGEEEGARGAAVLEETETATVWPGLKPLGRLMPNWVAQVAGSSPWWEY